MEAAERRRTRLVRVGDQAIGDGGPILVQSMVKAQPHDGPAILDQLERLAAVGCDLCRLTIPDQAAADTLRWLAPRSPMPLVADIHFDYRLALAAVEAGASKLRVNPGNLGGLEPLRQVAKAAGAAGLPIRIGVNLGSLETDLAAKHGYTGEAMAVSALAQVRLLEDLGFGAIVISAKAPDVRRTVEAYRMIAAATDWPLHLGVTEAGPGIGGLVKSSVGLGLLLSEGIGDTLRVSLSGDPVDEVRAGHAVLASLGLRRRGPELVACPTCGRCDYDLISLAERVAVRLESIREPLVVAVMGCAVNGPGEAKRADVGLAAADRDRAVLFAGGRVLRSVPWESAEDELFAEIDRLRHTATTEVKPQ